MDRPAAASSRVESKCAFVPLRALLTTTKGRWFAAQVPCLVVAGDVATVIVFHQFMNMALLLSSDTSYSSCTKLPKSCAAAAKISFEGPSTQAGKKQ